MEEKHFDKLDYTIREIDQRVALVNTICEQYKEAGVEINTHYLTTMADYCLGLDIKKEYKDKSILTKNRMVTIYKREMSYEGLQEVLPGGDNDIHNLICDNPKLYYLTNRNKITEEDLEKYPELKALKENIENLKKTIEESGATGKRLFTLKSMLINMQQQQYIIKTLKEEKNLGILNTTRAPKSTSYMVIEHELYEDENGDVRDKALINLADKEHVKALLHYYSMLKEDTWDKLDADLKYLMWDLEKFADKALEEKKPVWYQIMIRKIDGWSNEQIADELKVLFNIDLSVNTISTTWCNGIPKAIAEEAAKSNTIDYYRMHNKKMKTCSKCHRQLPPTKLFFHTNNKSSDKLYSICKECRKVV